MIDWGHAVWSWLAHSSMAAWEMRLVYAAAVPQTLFALGFGIFAHWWTSLIGRGLFFKAVALALLLDLAVAQDLWGDYPHRKEITLAIVVMIFVGATQQFFGWAIEEVRFRRSGERVPARRFADTDEQDDLHV